MPKKLSEKDVLETLQTTLLYDLTDLKKKKQRWMYIFTKQRPNETWTHEWVEDRLVLFPVNTSIQTALIFYHDLFGFHLKEGKVKTMIGKSISEEDRDKLKKDIGWKKGEIVVGFPTKDGKHISFKTMALDKLKIQVAVEYPKEVEEQMKNQLLSQMEQKVKDMTDLIKEYKGQWLHS